MSKTDSPGAIYTRGNGDLAFCNYDGCSWKYIGGVRTWVCCCNRYLCNISISTFKSNVGFLIIVSIIINILLNVI